jgi:Protein of unknown function (DUF2934)
VVNRNLRLERSRARRVEQLSGLLERGDQDMAKERHASERDNEPQDMRSDPQPLQDEASQAETSDHDLISRRAYERFQARGGEHGRDQDDWLDAERELNGRGE